MEPYITNIEHDTITNTAFRNVVFTSKHQQLVLMSIEKGDDIGMEKHDHVDQFIRIERGEALAILGINEEEFYLKDGSSVNIPAGTWHNIINIGREPLKLYTIYSPPNHRPSTFQQYK